MSGRAPSTNVAAPTNTNPLDCVGSPASGERYTSTPVTPESSTAHPVNPTSPATMLASPGASKYPKGAAGDKAAAIPCETLMTLSATVTCPVRAMPDALAAAVNSTTPTPLPLAPDVTVIQAAALVAV